MKEDTNFNANRGWLDHFCKRVGLHNTKLQREAASADTAVAEKFKVLKMI